MRPIKTEACNVSLAPPPDWDESKQGPCKNLTIHRNGGIMMSYWKPSARDIWRMICGDAIRLSIAATGHPPVAMGVDPNRLKEIP